MARIALVTGGSRGIGAAISKALKAQGCTVVATYAGNDEAAAKFTEETGIKTYKWNVGDYDESKAGIEKVESEVGPIDIVVANAGITRDAPFHKMTPQQWNEVIDTNLTGVFNTVHPIWPGMRERKFGRVIVISSINGQKGQFAQVNYAATKAGDLGIVKSLAQEGARAGITANAICPGYIATEMVMAVPEKVRESIIGQIPAGPPRRTRGNRPLRGLPGLRRRRFHQRFDDLGQRRPVLRLIRALASDTRNGRSQRPAIFCSATAARRPGTKKGRTPAPI